MAEYLLIRVPGGTGEKASWVVWQDGGMLGARSESGELSSAASVAAGRRVVLMVPGTDVLLTDVTLPTQKRHKIQRVVPFALEDQMAEDVENLHFALGPRLDDGSYPVAVVNRNRMQHWLDMAAAAGLAVDFAVPDCLLVPVQQDGWSLLLEGDCALVRTGPYGGFAADRDSVAAIIAMSARGAEPALSRLTQYGCDGALPLDLPDGLEAASAPCAHGALNLLARQFKPGLVMNLVQGDYSRKEQMSQIRRAWMGAAALVLLGVVLVAVHSGLEYRALHQENQRLTQRIETVYRELFPGAQRVVNPRSQMEQRLLELRQGKTGNQDEFLELLNLCGGVLEANTGIQLQGASYRDRHMDLDITAQSLQELDRLKQQLATAGQLEVEIQSATSDENQKVQSRLRLRKAGA